LVERLGIAGRTAASRPVGGAYRGKVAVSELAVEPSAPESTDRAATLLTGWVVAPGIFAAVSLVYLTLAKFGAGGLGAAWSLAQVLLVFVACFDFVTHRIPNRVTIPATAVVLILRLAFATETVPEALIAGVAGFAAFSSS